MAKTPELPYPFNALEPYFPERTVADHYHVHEDIVGQLNKTFDELNGLFSDWDVENLLKNIDTVPREKRHEVLKNGSAHFNHTLFWSGLTKEGGGRPQGELLEAINRSFGSLELLQKSFNLTAVSLFDTGWAWLVVNSKKELEVVTTKKSDNPIVENMGTPILAVDMWEHAYKEAFGNNRLEYLKAIWDLINWNEVEKRYMRIMHPEKNPIMPKWGRRASDIRVSERRFKA